MLWKDRTREVLWKDSRRVVEGLHKDSRRVVEGWKGCGRMQGLYKGSSRIVQGSSRVVAGFIMPAQCCKDRITCPVSVLIVCFFPLTWWWSGCQHTKQAVLRAPKQNVCMLFLSTFSSCDNTDNT